MGIMDVFEYINKLNQQNYAGYNTWRLPSLEELLSLVTDEEFENSYSSCGTLKIKKVLADEMRVDVPIFWAQPYEGKNGEDIKFPIVLFDAGVPYAGMVQDRFHVRCIAS